jgi:hypothetical protein
VICLRCGLAGQLLFVDPWHDGRPRLWAGPQDEPGLAGLDAGQGEFRVVQVLGMTVCVQPGRRVMAG